MLAKDATNNSVVELESVCGDQRGTFEIHSAGYVLKESERISVASSSCDGRRPKPRPDVNRRENPDRMFFFADDRPHLFCLKLRNVECRYFPILEPTTKAGCLFEPSIDGIPGDLLYSGDRTLVQALDARPTGNLGSKARRRGLRAGRLDLPALPPARNALGVGPRRGAAGHGTSPSFMIQPFSQIVVARR
jgi:hypothetical protein